MTKPSLSGIARDLGVSRQSVSKWVADAGGKVDLRSLRARAAGAKRDRAGRDELREARIRKTRAEACRAERLADVEAGRLVPRDQVMREATAAGVWVRERISSIRADLPPLVAGLPAAAAADVLEPYVHKLLTELSEGFTRRIPAVGGSGRRPARRRRADQDL